MAYQDVAPDGVQAVSQLEAYVKHSGLEARLIELIKIMASQLNGCAYCIDMHTQDARNAGETEQRLYGLVAWKETPFYSVRERAALTWTEAVTCLDEGHVPDSVYTEAKLHFNDKELVDLTLAISVINIWNRLAICFRTLPGSYHAGMKESEEKHLDTEI
jgi:AhpD family alkylhydroperoxidase